MENLKLKKIVANLFETGLMDVDDIIKINDNYPDAIDRAKEICNEIGVQMNFGILIRALTEIVKDYIDYSQLNNEISYKIETLSSGEVIDICDELETFINSISVDDNGVCWGDVCYSIDSRFKDVENEFSSLVKCEITMDEFYESVSDIVSNILLEEIKRKKIENLKPIAVYTVSNNCSLFIYEINHGINDSVLLGPSVKDIKDIEDIKECVLDGDVFKYEDMELNISDFVRLND